MLKNWMQNDFIKFYIANQLIYNSILIFDCKECLSKLFKAYMIMNIKTDHNIHENCMNL